MFRYEDALEIYRAGFQIQETNYEITIGLADTLREVSQTTKTFFIRIVELQNKQNF